MLSKERLNTAQNDKENGNQLKTENCPKGHRNQHCPKKDSTEIVDTVINGAREMVDTVINGVQRNSGYCNQWCPEKWWIMKSMLPEKYWILKPMMSREIVDTDSMAQRNIGH
ncbi:hypothetical protein RRG08_026626 [Elysia crispata]|uniref:Uncharacterized protein n=1 Tax=Elysia crispata TaxID=231223 RepID=A0AAE1AZ77_9GAST|nr:hypothetical protein RRG08_026626 [Elysia crispata]